MNEILAVVLVVLLAVSGYAAGRMHGQYSYHVGYRFGYRHGYYDGDRASWNRRRRELQNAVAAVLHEPGDLGEPDRTAGTTYASSTYDDEPTGDEDAGVDGAEPTGPISPAGPTGAGGAGGPVDPGGRHTDEGGKPFADVARQP